MDEEYWKGVPGITWLLLAFALFVVVAGFSVMAIFATNVTPEAITALVTAVFGVVATHIGHMAGHQAARRQLEAQGRSSGVMEVSPEGSGSTTRTQGPG
jgi:uncharacterized membrane protein